jgi:hypothetical protein
MPAHRDPIKKGKAAPLIRSSALLRGVATAITLSSLGGMTSFAATHVQNTAAPLQPSASTTTTAVTPTATAAPAATGAPAAMGRTSTTTTRRSTTITGAVTTTTTARSKTKSS